MSRRHFAALRRSALAISLVSGLLSSTGRAETYSSLPPPPQNASAVQNQQYNLELIVNGQDTGAIVPVEFRDNHYLLRAADLQQAGVPSPQITSSIMDVSVMPEVKAEYDRARQRLLLTVPPAWLPQQKLSGPEQNGPHYPGRTSTGALLNYDLYASHTSASSSQLSAFNTFRLFGDQGQLSTNGVWQDRLSGQPGAQDKGYLRYDTWWGNQDENHSLSWRAGDLITDSLSWSNSVRLGGIQIARDFSVRPDLVTYPLPSFSGQAAVPSTIDLFVNGYKNSTNSVQPGPWTMTNMPFVNGAGDAVVVTTDAVGRRVTTTLPFYVSSDLLKPGLSDFSFSAGALRQNYGLKNFDYGSAAVSGSYRYGLTRWLTLESHAEGADTLALGGVGGLVRMGAFGVANAALTQSQLEADHGNQYSWGYQYNNSRFSLGMQHIIRSVDFGNLALYGDRTTTNNSDQSLSRRSAQYSASLSLNSFGSIGAAFIDMTAATSDRTQLWNLSWSKNLWGNSNLYVSTSHDQQQGEWSGAISLVIPFGERTNASLSVERDAQGGSAQRVTATRAMPTDGGFAYDASWANQSSSSAYRQGSLSWRNQKIETSAGFYGDDDSRTEWGDITGSLVLMDSRFFAANQVNDAFVLVKTDYPAINVSYENQLMGKTDKKGYLLVPGISSYYPAKYDIDTLHLPASVTISQVEQRFAVKRNSGYLLRFPIEPLRAASVILHDLSGQPLPISTQILRQGQEPEYVGWDGIVWMENLSAKNPFRAVTPDGRQCEAVLNVAGGRPETLQTYGPLTCALPPLPGISP